MDRDSALLPLALETLVGKGLSLEGYSFAAVEGATQATVWKGEETGPQPHGPLALRLTPKPAELVRRIASLTNGISQVECPETLAVEEMTDEGRRWTVHLCTWIGSGPVGRADMRILGHDLAELHRSMASSPVDFTDRKLSFERTPTPSPEQQLPAWYVARNIWRDRIFAWLSIQTSQVPVQPIHGDMHWGNIVTTSNGFGFIDFDKLMYAPPVFDLAKIVATGMFRRGGDRIRFQARRTTELLEGYESVRSLSDAELVALEGLAVLLNEETARLGTVYDVESYRKSADAVASWWIARRRRSRHDPLGIRGNRNSTASHPEEPEQEPLWPDD